MKEKKSVSFVNEGRLLTKIGRFFKTTSQIYTELLQNSCRAGAKNASLEVTGNRIVYKDDGHGVEDPKVLLTLAESDWELSSVEQQDPAGLGLFALISAALNMKVVSKFGTLSLDCPRFLRDADYRNGVLDTVDGLNRAGGLLVEAVFAETAPEIKDETWAFPMSVTINGKKTEMKGLEKFRAEHKNCGWAYREFEYQGCKGAVCLCRMNAWYHDNHRVNWYGQMIGVRPAMRGAMSFLDVDRGTPVTPKLPDREALVEDAKLKAYVEFIDRMSMEMALNRLAALNDKEALESWDLLEAYVGLAVEYDKGAIKRLPYVVIRKSNLNEGSTFGGHIERVVLRQGADMSRVYYHDGYEVEMKCVGKKPKKGNVLSNAVKNGTVMLSNFTSKGSFFEKWPCDTALLPDWLGGVRVPTKTVLEVSQKEDGENIVVYEPKKTALCLTGKTLAGKRFSDRLDMEPAAFVRDWSPWSEDIGLLIEGNDIGNLVGEAFDAFIFNEDSESGNYDSQKYDYEQEMDVVLAKAFNTVSKSRVFSSEFEGIAKNTKEIKSVVFAKKHVVVTYEKGSRKKILLAA